MAPQIKLNNKPVEIDVSGLASLSDVIAAISGRYFGPHEIITDVSLNDTPVDIESLDVVMATPVARITSLNLGTVSSPQAKGAELLKEMGEYLKRLTDGMGQLADTFRVGSAERANAMLADALEGLSAFVELVQTAKMLSRSDMSSLVFDGESMTSMEEKLLEVLKEFKGGQEDEDWVTVADLLEYELSPLLEWWRAFIPRMEAELLKDPQ